MARLTRLWQKEQASLLAGRLTLGLNGGLLLLLALAAWRVVGEGVASQPFVMMLWAVLGAGWVGVLVLIFYFRFRKPSPLQLAKRADAVLGLPDDLLSLTEWPEATSPEWHQAGWERTRLAIETLQPEKTWPVAMSARTRGAFAGALCLSAGIVALNLHLWQKEAGRIAAQEAMIEARVAQAEEMLHDWQAFSKETDDPELKALFAQAQMLEAALREADPMSAMLEINRLEAEIGALDRSINAESIAPHSEKMAEAFEAMEGMSALSAALKQGEYASAREQAEKLARELEQKVDQQSAIRRSEAVSEMLGAEAKSAAEKGNRELSEALNELDEAVSAKKGQAENQALLKPMKTLTQQFAKEANRQNRGRMTAAGKQHLDALRARLQGSEGEQGVMGQSLMSMNQSSDGKQGGLEAGAGKGGQPLGTETDLAKAQRAEQVTGQVGEEGDSEKRTLAAATGSGKASGEAGEKGLPQYIELSRKAVADENLPLAHRRVIRTYFEKIRPMTETQHE